MEYSAGRAFLPAVTGTLPGREVSFLFFTARPQAVARYLPEPLEPDPDGNCVVAGIDVPFCTSYGSFQEAFIALKCRFHGNPGYYCSHILHNGPAGIAAGREVYGSPKIFAAVSVTKVEGSMSTEASVAGAEVIRLNTINDEIASPAEMPALTPAFRLKIIPRADGPGPALKQLIDCTRATKDLVVHAFARGRGTLRLSASSPVDLSPLEPVSSGEAFYMEADYSEDYAEIVYDYLKK